MVSAGPSTGRGGFGGGPARFASGGFGRNGPPTGFGGGKARAFPRRSSGGGFRGGFGRAEGASTSKALVSLLQADAGKYEWVLATGSSQSAAPLQLVSGEPVMALGGFTGSDPAMTLARFERLVAQGKIHYFLDEGMGGGRGSSSQIASWVAAHFKKLTDGGTTLYDLTRQTG